MAEGKDARLLAWDQSFALLATEQAVVEAVEVPALVSATEDGSNRTDRAPDHVDRTMVLETVKRARV